MSPDFSRSQFTGWKHPTVHERETEVMVVTVIHVQFRKFVALTVHWYSSHLVTGMSNTCLMCKVQYASYMCLHCSPADSVAHCANQDDAAALSHILMQKNVHMHSYVAEYYAKRESNAFCVPCGSVSCLNQPHPPASFYHSLFFWSNRAVVPAICLSVSHIHLPRGTACILPPVLYLPPSSFSASLSLSLSLSLINHSSFSLLATHCFPFRWFFVPCCDSFTFLLSFKRSWKAGGCHLDCSVGENKRHRHLVPRCSHDWCMPDRIVEIRFLITCHVFVMSLYGNYCGLAGSSPTLSHVCTAKQTQHSETFTLCIYYSLL